MLVRSLKWTVVFVGLVLATCFAVTTGASAQVGASENGILVEQWRYPLAPRYWWGLFGSSAAIADLGSDVNNKGTEPDSDLEIVNGCDGDWFYSPELGYSVPGLWRAWDSGGNIEWATSTQSDEARGSPAIIDINGDGYLEIAAGTTSGETVEVMNRFGNFVWTFPDPPRAGNFMWPGGPAVADVNRDVGGLEVIAGNRALGIVFCFDGDNSDGVDEGISSASIDWWSLGTAPWAGTEGVDWDLLWIYDTGGWDMYSSPAVGDVDDDGDLEVVIGSDNGNIYVLDGASGSLEKMFATGGSVYASAALANLDGDAYIEIVIGSTDGKVYCFQWDGTTGSTEWTFSTGGAVYSSAAIGDADGDGSLEIVVGSTDGRVYSISTSGSQEWNYQTGGAIYSSPALANRASVGAYNRDWPMFRHDPRRTGFYGQAPTTGLDVYVGSNDAYLYLLEGNDGSMIDRFLTLGEIRTSPSVADVDGDNKLEIFCYDWSSTDTFWAIEDPGIGVITVEIDIKPGSDPNAINPDSKGVIPVAILTTSTAKGESVDFDATTVDPLSVKFGPGEATEAHGEGHIEDVDSDGDLDMVLHFKTQDTGIEAGDTEASLTGNTVDGKDIQGSDAIVTVPKGKKAPSLVEIKTKLLPAYPGVANPETWIPFRVGQGTEVTITLYNMTGQIVRTLELGYRNLGVYVSKEKAAYWDGRNEYGERVSSGIYFYRMTAGKYTAVRKMVVLK